MRKNKNFSKSAPANKKTSRRSGPNEKTLEGRIVSGRHACEEVLRIRPEAVEEIWVESLSSNFGVLARQKGLDSKLVVKPARHLESYCFSHQGCVMSVSQNLSWNGVCQKGIYVAVDGVSDPHNLGAIIRTCWLMGVHSIFIKESRSTLMTPAAHKVASGGAEHVPVEFVSSLEGLIKQFKEQDFWVYALEAGSGTQVHQVEYPDKVLWVLGGEDRGVSRSVMKVCDELLELYMSSSSLDAGASYNMSVALSMALVETRRQHMLLGL